jgi:hypothetical protein
MQNSCAPNFSLQVKPLRSYWVVVIDGMGELEQKVIFNKITKGTTVPRTPSHCGK